MDNNKIATELIKISKSLLSNKSDYRGPDDYSEDYDDYSKKIEYSIDLLQAIESEIKEINDEHKYNIPENQEYYDELLKAWENIEKESKKTLDAAKAAILIIKAN